MYIASIGYIEGEKYCHKLFTFRGQKCTKYVHYVQIWCNQACSADRWYQRWKCQTCHKNNNTASCVKMSKGTYEWCIEICSLSHWMNWIILFPDSDINSIYCPLTLFGHKLYLKSIDAQVTAISFMTVVCYFDSNKNKMLQKHESSKSSFGCSHKWGY